MKAKIFALLSYLLVSIISISCSDDNRESQFAEDNNISGSKWTLINWDYSLGDDYIGLHDETYNFFFYSQTEGVFYYGKKDNYSDQGSSNMRVACHFNYEVIAAEWMYHPYHFEMYQS